MDNIDIRFLNIIPDMLQSLMDKKKGVPKELYDNYENMENGIDAVAEILKSKHVILSIIDISQVM